MEQELYRTQDRGEVEIAFDAIAFKRDPHRKQRARKGGGCNWINQLSGKDWNIKA